jgi:hypothetical protein
MAPLGRLNYVYQNYIPGVSTDIKAETVITMAEKAEGEDKYVPDNTETEAVTDPESTPDTDAVTDPETNSETETAPADVTGCKAIAGGAVLMAVICLGALMLGKKKD